MSMEKLPLTRRRLVVILSTYSHLWLLVANEEHRYSSLRRSHRRFSMSENLPHLQGMGRRQRRAAETRLRLFRCALQLFAERGFPNVTVEDITEAADVGKGTFFNYFESKDHVLGVMAEIQLGKVREASTLAESASGPFARSLHRLFLRVAEEPGRSPDLARALISSFLASTDVRELIERNMSEGRKMVAQVVATGQKRGEIDPA